MAVPCIDKLLYPLPGILINIRGPDAQFISSPVGIGIAAAIAVMAFCVYAYFFDK